MAKKKDQSDYGDQLRVEGVCCKGYGTIPKAVMRDPDLSITAKAIYAYFAAMSGSGDSTFPSRETILSHIHLNKSTYLKHRQQLTEQGYILVTKNRNGGEFENNTYTLVSFPEKYQYMTPQNDWQNELISTIEQDGLDAAGYGKIPRAVMQDPRMDASAKALYAYFSSYAGGGRVAFPPVPQICRDLGISAGTYQKRMKVLQELDYIEVRQTNWDKASQPKPGEKKRGFGGNRYIIKNKPDPVSHHKISDTVKSDMAESDVEESTTIESDKEASYHKISDTVKSDTTNNIFLTNNTKSKNTSPAKNSYQSILSEPEPASRGRPDGIDRKLLSGAAERDYVEYFHSSPEYQLVMMSRNKEAVQQIDEAILLMASVCSKPSETTIRIGGEEKLVSEVRERFLKLTTDHIIYAVNSFNRRCNDATDPIQNVRAYMLTTLYRTPESLASSHQAGL